MLPQSAGIVFQAARGVWTGSQTEVRSPYDRRALLSKTEKMSRRSKVRRAAPHRAGRILFDHGSACPGPVSEPTVEAWNSWP